MVKKNESQKSNKSIFKSAATLLLIIVAGLLFSRVVLSNILATSGQRFAAANQETKLLENENQKLENEISKLNSLARAEKFAQKRGFIKTTNVKILSPSGPIAQR
jgi:peptidoglycan hydrolase CwlO-like protein